MYSINFNNYFQDEPQPYRRSPHKLWGWTDTVVGYVNEAKKAVSIIIENNRLCPRVYHTATVRFPLETVEDAKRTWAKCCRSFRTQNIICLWVRECCESNKLHYHLLIVADGRNAEQTTDMLRNACPSSEHIQVKHLSSGTLYRYASYVYKAGSIHAPKRRMFKPKLGLKKHGTIGQFWSKPKCDFWKEIQDREKAIGEASKLRSVQDEAKELHDLIEPSVSYKQVLRRTAQFHLLAQEGNEPEIIADNIPSLAPARSLDAIEEETRLPTHVSIMTTAGREMGIQAEIIADGSPSLPSRKSLDAVEIETRLPTHVSTLATAGREMGIQAEIIADESPSLPLSTPLYRRKWTPGLSTGRLSTPGLSITNFVLST